MPGEWILDFVNSARFLSIMRLELRGCLEMRIAGRVKYTRPFRKFGGA
jgi:hypothetical protein